MKFIYDDVGFNKLLVYVILVLEIIVWCYCGECISKKDEEGFSLVVIEKWG